MNRAAQRLPLILSLFSAAAFPAPADPWLRIQSANFELFTTASERAGRELVQHFERVRSFFLQVFGVKSTNGKPVRIIAFHSEKEFRPYRPNEVAAAFYYPGAGHDYILMDSGDASHYPVATHEYTHLLIGQMDGAVPLWLNEGLAELYSTIEPADSRIVVGLAPAGRAQSLLLERWIDLDALLATTATSPLYNEKSHASMFYAESWALVHMLNLDHEYRQHLPALLDALKTMDSVEAFQKTYGESLPQVQTDLQTYVNGKYLHGLAIEAPLPEKAAQPEIETHAALHARLALAELLSDYPGKLNQAVDGYAALGRNFPQSSEVAAAQGHFAWRERRNQEAVNHFAHAIELGATEPAIFIDYSRALSVTNHADQAIAVLRDAIRLHADFKEAHFELGLLLERTGAWREAVAELQLSRPLKAPQASRYFYAMAYGEFQLGDMIAARNYVEQGRPYIRIPEEVSAMEQLSRSLGPPIVDGVLQSIECQGKLASLHVRVGDVAHIFLIPDLTSATELECGPQKDLPVRIEFQAMPLGTAGADGIVRSLAVR